MAIRIDLPIEQVRDILKTKLAVLNRSINTQGNPLIKEILQKDAHAIQTAMNTLAETK